MKNLILLNKVYIENLFSKIFIFILIEVLLKIYFKGMILNIF